LEVLYYRSSSGASPVEKFIHSLESEEHAMFIATRRGIQRLGLNFDWVLYKPVKGKIWEIKFKCNRVQFRIFYFLKNREQMIWLLAFKKKDQKLKQRMINLAERRMKEV